MGDIDFVVEILKESGIRIDEYKAGEDRKDGITGKLIVMNDLPFFLLDNVCKDVLSSKEKMIIFVEQLKSLRKHG